MIIQISLTVPEAKRVIAKGVAFLPEVQQAKQQGKILFKGGTTVSAVAEELTGTTLRLSGRISPRGAMGYSGQTDFPHCILYEKGVITSADGRVVEVLQGFTPRDLVIIGANALDIQGQPAMMAGTPFGDYTGYALSGLYSEGIPVIVAVGLEKLIPGRLTDVIRLCGRRLVDRSLGMAVGLIPLPGRVVTEKDAIEILANVNCTVIGKGGINGAEGATTMLVSGSSEEVEKIWQLVMELKAQTQISAAGDSLIDCVPPNPTCKRHRGCYYKKLQGDLVEANY